MQNPASPSPKAVAVDEIPTKLGPNVPTACDVGYLELQTTLISEAQCSSSTECGLIALPVGYEWRRRLLMKRWFTNADQMEQNVLLAGAINFDETRGIRLDRIEPFRSTIAAFNESCPLTARSPEVAKDAISVCVDGICLFDGRNEEDDVVRVVEP